MLNKKLILLLYLSYNFSESFIGSKKKSSSSSYSSSDYSSSYSKSNKNSNNDSSRNFVDGVFSGMLLSNSLAPKESEKIIVVQAAPAYPQNYYPPQPAPAYPPYNYQTPQYYPPAPPVYHQDTPSNTVYKLKVEEKKTPFYKKPLVWIIGGGIAFLAYKGINKKEDINSILKGEVPEILDYKKDGYITFDEKIKEIEDESKLTTEDKNKKINDWQDISNSEFVLNYYFLNMDKITFNIEKFRELIQKINTKEFLDDENHKTKSILIKISKKNLNFLKDEKVIDLFVKSDKNGLVPFFYLENSKDEIFDRNDLNKLIPLFEKLKFSMILFHNSINDNRLQKIVQNFLKENKDFYDEESKGFICCEPKEFKVNEIN